jgi:hypothetical protein
MCGVTLIELFALAAKPVVDIQVSVADLDDEDRYVPPCEAGRLWADATGWVL